MAGYYTPYYYSDRYFRLLTGNPSGPVEDEEAPARAIGGTSGKPAWPGSYLNRPQRPWGGIPDGKPLPKRRPKPWMLPDEDEDEAIRRVCLALLVSMQPTSRHDPLIQAKAEDERIVLELDEWVA
ncbi:MAG TPA: hypothetical protein DCP69_04940 [Candidatus Omnitrophica bacterium]|nr:hypothetical protein [Candidatus Omnitrophota bacterium]